MSSPTIYDVAKAAGVGAGTVSRVLNNSTQVSPETQEKVLAAIRELGFRRSKVARQLSTGVQHRNVGAIMQFITHPSFVERLRGMQLALDHHGNNFNLVLYNVSEPDRSPEQILNIVEQVAVDGLLIAALNITAEQQELLTQNGIPFVTLSDAREDHNHNISFDNVHGGYLAVRDPQQIKLGLVHWRSSAIVGVLSVCGSAGWALALALENAAKVRTLGQVELLFALAVSAWFLHERHQRAEYVASALVVVGVVTVILAG